MRRPSPTAPSILPSCLPTARCSSARGAPSSRPLTRGLTASCCRGPRVWQLKPRLAAACVAGLHPLALIGREGAGWVARMLTQVEHSLQARLDRPPNDVPRGRFQHDREIQIPAIGRDVRDGSNLESVWTLGGELVVDGVYGRFCRRIGMRRDDERRRVAPRSPPERVSRTMRVRLTRTA